jgi:16S rRNA (cytosine1402-N4)-methyltransferase
VVEASIPKRSKITGGHPAKRTFQAVRIEVNQELGVLSNTLDTMIELLKPGGRISIITFHSLEDRIVKNAFKRNENPCICPPEFPVCTCGRKSKGRVVSRKPVLPSKEELERNRRSASAKLRIFEKTTEVS